MILNMDCIEGMHSFPDNYFHAIVTDPPYELGFMGKTWDASGIAYNVAMWREALRVLKPGGHMLAFSGSRTYHRMVCAIEDAGFEVRDQIMWVYGSGFPKSLDVSKAIDKTDASEERTNRRYRFTKWFVSACSLSKKEINTTCGTSDMARHWTDCRPDGKQPDVPTREYFEKLRPHVGDVPHWVEAMVDERTVESENFKAREVVGQRTTGIGTGGGSVAIMGDGSRDLTAAHTPAAQKWQGWGTALKPAHEPICVARKPLAEGTVAANVLEWGTGAMNIDGCRVDTDAADPNRRNNASKDANGGIWGEGGQSQRAPTLQNGRWPANLIHNGSEDVLAAFPDACGQLAKASTSDTQRAGQNVYGDMARGSNGSAPRLDNGSAARFFYCAKASKSDRSETNIHPTVKPTDLMRYLCRLITPPGGTVLDPFAGSGSTGKAAVLEGFSFVGFELSAEYAAIAQARIDAARLKK